MILPTEEGFDKYGELFLDRDAAAVAADCNETFFVESAGGAAFFIQLYPGAFEAHYLMRVRGKDVITSSKRILKELFNETNAKVVTGYISVDNRPALAATRRIGFKSVAVVDHPKGKHELFVIYREDVNE